jgi:hypothetical protein
VIRASVALVLAVTTGSCAGSNRTTTEPSGTVRAYAAALRGADAARAWELLSDDQRAQVEQRRVAALLARHRTELRELATALDAAAPAIRAHARVPLAQGGNALVVLEHGEWKLSGNVLGAPRLRTPLEAVLALRQALARRSLRGVERVLSRSRREAMRAEIERIVDETGDELDLTVEVEGNRARVRTTGGREILLVRELGEWHVTDLR